MTKTKRKKFLLIACIISGLLILLLAAALDTRLTVRTYTLDTEKVSDPVRLAVLTDLHSCAYGDGQEELVNAVAQAGPDAVLLVGDIVDDVLPQENAWTAVAQLADSYPCFYVTGNHEWWSGEAEEIIAQMETYGVTVLRGSSALLTTDSGQSITIWGIDDPDSNLDDQLEQVQISEKDNNFTVLMAHRPEEIDNYLSYGFDLILSGHAHGGQWRLPGLINGLFAPNQGLFPPYAGGAYTFENTTMIVSRGLARESTRIPRIFNPPELVVVDVVPA